MLVKILNTGNVDGPHYTYNDPNDYIIDNVVDVKRHKYLFRIPDASHDMSTMTMKRADNSVVEIAANGLVFICNDDGKTIEKIEHKCQSYGLLALEGRTERDAADAAMEAPTFNRPEHFLEFGPDAQWAVSLDDSCLCFHPRWKERPGVRATHIWNAAWEFVQGWGGFHAVETELKNMARGIHGLKPPIKAEYTEATGYPQGEKQRAA